MPFITPSMYSWNRREPAVDLQLRDCREGTGVTPDVFREVVQEQYGECRKIFTNGLKTAGGV